MRCFGMVSTRHSRSYTRPAIASFLENTDLGPDDLLLLIDNDGTLNADTLPKSEHIELVRNEEPRSFAANINQLLQKALLRQADAFILHNDALFTKGWLPPLEPHQAALLSPLSNRHIQYKRNSFSCSRSMELEDCSGHEDDLAIIAEVHRQRRSGYSAAPFIPFFCARLPYQVYSAVGLLDESLSKKGTEDIDYCCRAQLQGFKCGYAMASYVIHFSGRSTWNGAETKRQTDERLKTSRDAMIGKWGASLCSVILDNDLSMFAKHPAAGAAQQQGDFAGAIKALLQADGKSVPAAGPLATAGGGE